MLQVTLALTILAQQPHPNPSLPKNHLEGETSPYLLQHVHNPVDWYPWSAEALDLAKQQDKVIFLSIGYSACHWCHVMAHESFENEEIAAYLNKHFVCVKVDREERPDLDDLYMTAVQRMTGSGGWPMSVFLTPELKPFYGGTYFPPTSRHGRPGFLEILENLQSAWLNRRDEIETSADQLTGMLEMAFPEFAEHALPSAQELSKHEKDWLESFQASFDSEWGGFGTAPKFPAGDALRWLLQLSSRQKGEIGESALQMAELTLQKMAKGGMYDQLGGGFARYSVDEKWLIPHFEKMLYDQGTLIPAYLDAWQQTSNPFYERIARESCDYLLRERRIAQGGFKASTDADSEGEEGLFYVWTPATLRDALAATTPPMPEATDEEKAEWLNEEVELALKAYGVNATGNFEHGTSALTRWAPLSQQEEAELLSIRTRLLAQRALRIPPTDDDKILTAWNGLAIGALAKAGRMLHHSKYTEAAQDAARFLMNELRQPNGSYYRSWRKGQAQHSAVLEDYAYLCLGLLELFQSTGEEKWLTEATQLGERISLDFCDPETGILWDTDGKDKTLLHRMKSPWDGAIPSPNAVALEAFLLLHAFTQADHWKEKAVRGHQAIFKLVDRNPRAYPATLRTLYLCQGETDQAPMTNPAQIETKE